MPDEAVEFPAETMIGYTPPEPALGVPEMEAVPSPLSEKVIPLGTEPATEIEATG